MIQKVDWDRKREEWRGLVEGLMTEIAAWAKAQRWPVNRAKRFVTEEHLGRYEVPDLTIRVPGGQVSIEVVGRNTVGAEGRVDILSFPNLNRMLLVRMGDQWKVKTDSLVDWPRPWSKETFIALAQALTSSQ